MSLAAIAAAANDLAALLEAKAPRGLRHPKHAQHIKPARAKIKTVMVRFFERQRKAVLADVKPKIKRALLLHPVIESKAPARDYEGGWNALNSHLVSVTATNALPDGEPAVSHCGNLPIGESSSTHGKSFARDLIPTNLHPLTFAATASEAADYNEAITALIGAAAESLGASAATSDDFAGEYLARNSLSKLTGGLDDTSIERLQDALANAWDKGGSYTDMVDAITETFDDFSETRAGLIAQTEANDAYSAARRETADALGLDEKRWDPDGEACPECQTNADQGWIDVDEDFDSGDDAPTAHPGCDCGCDYRKSSDSEDEE